MIELSACIEILFMEEPDFLRRIQLSAAAGLPAVEFYSFAGRDPAAIARTAKEAGVAVAAVSLDSEASLLDEGAAPTLIAGLRATAANAATVGCRRLIAVPGEERIGVSREQQHATVVANLAALAPIAADLGVTIVLEPLNTLVDHPGQFLKTATEGFQMVREVGSPSVKLLYDIYHMQVMEGNLTQTIRDNVALIGHFHAADVPGRYAPGTGEIAWPFLMKAIAASGYDGYFGLEYWPGKDTAASLAHIVDAARQAG
jgi:hydroxypyruvate isomerase